MKTILITGAAGFIGRNLTLALQHDSHYEGIAADIDTSQEEIDSALERCTVIIHLAGVNRLKRGEEYERGNVGSLSWILNRVDRSGRNPQILFSSSTQALLDTPYGRSKKKAEDLLLDYAFRTGMPARIFRLPGVFGKWCRPNYNSVVATFCFNIARDLPIEISDASKEIEIVHVDDVVRSFIETIDAGGSGVAFCEVSPSFQITLGKLAEIVGMFRARRASLQLTDLSDPFLRKLFGTYVSYLPSEGFSYVPEARADERGALAELLKADGYGQVFISRTNPGITRGNHYHNIKVEKLIVLKGTAKVRFRHMSTNEVVEYNVSGDELWILDIPPGWTHSIENTGSRELITLFWSSEIFNPARPDTYAAEVLK